MKLREVLIGSFLSAALTVSAAVRYVNVNNATPSPPFTSWATAATNIQDAVDVAVPGDPIIVTNGVYTTGGRAVFGTMTNRVAVDKPLTLQSVNGPKFTIIQGYQVPGTTNGDGAIRCVYLTNGASLSGFTLTNGATRAVEESLPFRETTGGGVHCEVGWPSLGVTVSNCIIMGNSACNGGGGVYGSGAYSGAVFVDCELRENTSFYGGGGAADADLYRCVIADNSAVFGGGACYLGYFMFCRLSNCLLVGNHAERTGGGTYGCDLVNCTVTGNAAEETGGGVSGFATSVIHRFSSITNSIVYANTPDNFVDYYTLFYKSCTTPLPLSGSDNIPNPPAFVDLVNRNFRLQPDSPCINAGNNAFATGPFDLDGNARVQGGTVDMGAYELQSQPVLRIALAGANVTLFWPLWAGDFELQQTLVLPPSPSDWSDVSSPPVIINGENTVTLPLTTEPRLFRLLKQ